MPTAPPDRTTSGHVLIALAARRSRWSAGIDISASSSETGGGAMHDFRRRGARFAPRRRHAAAVLSMVARMGANTAMFSVVDALLLRSLPVPAPHAWSRSPRIRAHHGSGRGRMSYDMGPGVRERQRRRRTASRGPWPVDLAPAVRRGRPTPCSRAGLLSTLGVPPLLGRTFSAPRVKAGRDGW